MNRRVLALVLLVVVTAPAFAGCAEQLGLRVDNPKWEVDLTLGLLLPPPNEGPLGDMMPAAELAARAINAADVGLRIRVVKETDTTDPVAAFDRLVEAGAVAVVGPGRPGAAEAVASRAIESQRVLALPSAVNNSLTQRDHGGYLMRVAVNEEVQGAALATLAEREGSRRIAVFHVDDAYGEGVAGALLRRFDHEVAHTSAYDPTNEQLVRQVARAACEAEWDTAVLVSYHLDAGWLVRGLQEGGCREDKAIFTGPFAHHPEMVDKAGQTAHGTPAAEEVTGIEPANSDMLAFHALFQTEYHHAPGPFAAEAYDAVYYIAAAALRSQGGLGLAEKDLEATIQTKHIHNHLVYTASQPGPKQRDLLIAAHALKTGDDIDWRGFAHDFDFTRAQEPALGTYKAWRVDKDGRFEYPEGYRFTPG